MKFKDIVNHNVVNIKNCEEELIHIPGSIQPHGLLLGLKVDNLIIEYCSKNSFEITGLKYKQCLGKGLESLLGKKQTKKLKRFVSSPEFLSPGLMHFKLCDQSFDCTVQKNNNIFLLEFEPAGDAKIEVVDINQQTKNIIDFMQKPGSLQMLCKFVADETRTITGYDRVMVYKFDDEYNGNVYAESKSDGMKSWMNLHYPHTDIPVQARALYLKNMLRIIPDVNYTPSPVFTIDDAPDKNLDLSMSILRSSSPIHLQYLKNMGVAASLTISLVHSGKLWGLIACHHNTPKYLSSDVRMAATIQGRFLTSQISNRELAEEYGEAKHIDNALNNLLAQVFSNEGLLIEDLIIQKDLLLITKASSVIIILNDKIFSFGNVPGPAEIKKLVNWLHTYSPATGINISSLSSLYPDAKKWSNIVSGVIYQPLGSGQRNCIIWCRPEVIQEVNWAGNPNESIVKDKGSLSPRNSFETWKEIKRYESSKWQNIEIKAASNFANAFQKHVHMLFLAEEELKQRNLKEKFKKADTELENLYWIGSHDLKEPLRKIQMFASRIMNEDNAGDFQMIFSSVKRMNDSAKRMQSLVSDILSYSDLSHVEDGLMNVNLNEVVINVIDELSLEIKNQDALVTYNDLPEVNGVSFFLQQLLVNLLRNSLKFSKIATPPVIEINYMGEVPLNLNETSHEMFHKITISDNGIGFDNQFKTSIFKVFTRLHNQNEYSGGSGVGLALCSKIMNNHKGYITADGIPGIGTTISLLFPTSIYR